MGAFIALAFYVGPLFQPNTRIPTATRTFTPIPATRTPTPGPCPADVDGSGTVTIDELIRAINAALEGCPK